jgi:quinol monooxygenase YgiN
LARHCGSDDDAGMIVIQGFLDFHPDDADKFEALVLPLQKASATEPGCVSYHFSRDLEVPGRFRVAECWENDSDLGPHFQTPAMAAFQAGMKDLRRTGGGVWKHSVSDRSKMM